MNKCPACYLNYVSWHIQMFLLLSSLTLVYHRLVYYWSQLDLVFSVFMWISLRGGWQMTAVLLNAFVVRSVFVSKYTG